MSNPQVTPNPAARVARATAVASGRALRFAGGFLAGMVAIPFGAAVVLFALWLAQPRPRPPGFDVTPGAEISQAGGVVAVWKGGGEYARQTCRDVCDDLAFRLGGVKPKDLRDAQGRRLKRDGRDWTPKLAFEWDDR